MRVSITVPVNAMAVEKSPGVACGRRLDGAQGRWCVELADDLSSESWRAQPMKGTEPEDLCAG